jgi:hypothetical protein
MVRSADYYGELFAAGLSRLYVSVDSLDPELANRLREGTSVARLTHLVRSLSVAFPGQVAVRTAVGRNNVDTIPALLAGLNDLGQLRVNLHPYDDMGNPDGVMTEGERAEFERGLPTSRSSHSGACSGAISAASGTRTRRGRCGEGSCFSRPRSATAARGSPRAGAHPPRRHPRSTRPRSSRSNSQTPRRGRAMLRNDPKVVVSATFKDLKHYRRVVIDALRRCGIVADPMEDWSADTWERSGACDWSDAVTGSRTIPSGSRHRPST